MKPSLSLDFLVNTFEDGLLVAYDKGHVIGYPHQKISHLYWLLEGQLKYYSILDQPKKEVLVSKISEPFMPVGWGAFISPYRFGLKIKVSSSQARLFKVPIKAINDYVTAGQQPLLIKKICSSLYHQLGLNLQMQGSKLKPKPIKEDEPEPENYFISPESTTQEMVQLFRRSPFLSALKEEYLNQLATVSVRRDYERGEEVIEQDSLAEGLFIIIKGEVALRRLENGNQVNMRSISTPGFLFGWSSLMQELDLLKAITTTKTSVYFISSKQLQELLQKDSSLSTEVYLRLVWLIGNQLNISFIRYLNLRLNHDILAVQNLIFNSKSRLKIASPLHKVPHLLNRLETKPDAFKILHDLNKAGYPLEQHISSISLDLLKSEERELKFMKGLQNIYEVVAENNFSESPEQVRINCAEATKSLFQNLQYEIEGLDMLPEQPGHIFIYNHLLNPPYYTLGNNFQITLDSHFISGLVLYEKYGEPGIRTVRIGSGTEYGHQDYYEKLGYINVYTKDSESIENQEKLSARDIFYTKANDFLDQNFNLIISPEGTSYTTEDSPGPFKTGAFRLAMQRKNTLIVPVVMCYFDRRIPNNTFYCKVLSPLNIREHVNPENEKSLYAFVQSTNELFQKELTAVKEKADKM